MFDDQGIERSKIIVPTVTQAIRESRISIIGLSKKYAFSSWCLDVLLEIMKRKEDIEQIVMSVFYGVDPSDVLKQTGNFGIAFNETCGRKTEEEQRKWSQALTYVGHIAGEHFQNWDNEAKMIEKIASDCEYVILNHSRLCLMASSYSSPCTWHYNVFTSFSGLDVRKTFLSHLRKQFNFNGITMFDDQGMERSQIIAPALTQAIRESRISIIVLPMNFASSSWCLDELLEILKCKEDKGQIVMSVFYGVDPSDVRKQTGDFGTDFNETCARKTRDAEKMEPSFDLCGQHAEEHFQNWENEAEMIEKIARDVLDKLNATPCRDFDGMVGLDDHLKEISVPKFQQCFIIENLPLRRLLGKSVARYAIAKKTRFACIQSILLRRSHSPLNREYLMPVGYSFKLFVEPHDHDMIIGPQ